MGEVSEFNETTTREVTGWDTDTSSKVQLRHGSRKNKYVSASRPARAGDQSFWGVGLSSLSVYAMLTSDHPDRDLNVGGSGGAWWWHSEHETLEKADMGVLSQDVSLYVSILLRLTTAGVLPMNFNHAEETERIGYQQAMDQMGPMRRRISSTRCASMMRTSATPCRSSA